MLSVLLFSFIPLLAAVIGAVIAAYYPPNATLRSYIQHLAAGVVFSVVAVELLPEITAKHEPIEVAIGFSFGVAAMLTVRRLAKAVKSRGSNNGLLIAVAIDVALDGLLIGISFSAGRSEDYY